MKLSSSENFVPLYSTPHHHYRHHRHLIATGQIYEDEKDIILDKTDLYKIPTLERFNQES